MMLNGRCQCGAVRYEVPDAFKYALNCHCSDCRQATGSAFKPLAGIERDALRLRAGADQVLIVGDAQADHDVRCERCGSLLYSVVREATYVHVTLGTLLDDPKIRPSRHIFLSDKAPWFTITDDLPQHEQY